MITRGSARYRIIIAGSRGFNDYELLKRVMKRFLIQEPDEEIEVISGTARGADKLGECWAKENEIPVIQFPADWKKHGKQAGYLRNQEMSKVGTHLVAFWDGESRGTKHMIDIALEKGLLVVVVDYTGTWIGNDE